MKFNINVALVDTNGHSPEAGVVNLYRTTDGRLVTGKKVYANEQEAMRRSRPARGWTFVRTVPVAEYQAQMPAIEAAARAAGIAFADAWLAGTPATKSSDPALPVKKKPAKRKVAAKKPVAKKSRR